MGVLIKNEWLKLFSRKASWMMQLFLLICMFGAVYMTVNGNNWVRTGITGSDGPKFKGGMYGIKTASGNVYSQEVYFHFTDDESGVGLVALTLDETIPQLEENLKLYKSQPEFYDQAVLKTTERQLAYYKSYQKSGETPVDPKLGTTSANFFSHFGSIYYLPTIFAVLIASMILATEFSSGTIKLLLIRPYKRGQILLAKYLVSLLYGLLSSVVMGISAFAFSYLLPYQSLGSAISAEMGDQTAASLVVQLFGSNFLLLMLYTTIALFFSAVVRSQALAVGVSLGILFCGSLLGQILPAVIAKYDWLKWLLFNFLGLNNQILDQTYLPGGTLSVSMTVIGLLVYIILIYGITHLLFNKRDVALS